MKSCESCGGEIKLPKGRSRRWLETARFCSRSCRGNGAPPPDPSDRRFWARVDRRGPAECWPWTGATGNKGYGVVRRHGKLTPASRHAYELTHGRLSAPSVQVCHSCDNPPCCNPAHLFAGTATQNEQDKIAKGRNRKAVGERAPTAKLTEDQVRAIRAEHAAGGISQSELARRYGVRSGTLRNVVLGISWRHVCA